MTPKIVITVFLIMLPFFMHADEMRHVNVTYQLDVEIVGTEHPHVVWRGQGRLRYRWHDGAGEIMGGDIPRMTVHCPVRIPGYDAVLMVVDGTPGSVASIAFEGTDVVVDRLSLDLDVMEAVAVAGVAIPPPRGRSMLQHQFPDLRLTSGIMVVGGQKLKGHLDANSLSADLLFTTIVPKTGNAELDDAIAGKVVVGRLHIALQ